MYTRHSHRKYRTVHLVIDYPMLTLNLKLRLTAKSTKTTTVGGAATCTEGFVNCFLRVPRLLGCTAAAMLPKQARGTYRKHATKPLEQVAAPPSTRCATSEFVVNIQ